jgi:hypothetical protein
MPFGRTRERVASDLAAARRAADEASERAKQVGILEKELSETDELLASMAGRKTLRLLDNLQIAAPCKADWDEMISDDRVRYCEQCEKNVYNVSAMPRAEAETFLVEREGTVCVRLYKRQHGTVLGSPPAAAVDGAGEGGVAGQARCPARSRARLPWGLGGATSTSRGLNPSGARRA